MPLISKEFYGDYAEQVFAIAWGFPSPGSKEVSLELKDSE
jgi:hypothetical protein